MNKKLKTEEGFQQGGSWEDNKWFIVTLMSSAMRHALSNSGSVGEMRFYNK